MQSFLKMRNQKKFSKEILAVFCSFVYSFGPFCHFLPLFCHILHVQAVFRLQDSLTTRFFAMFFQGLKKQIRITYVKVFKVYIRNSAKMCSCARIYFLGFLFMWVNIYTYQKTVKIDFYFSILIMFLRQIWKVKEKRPEKSDFLCIIE